MFMVDTHIHTCLSPCAELDMHPSAIVDAAVRAGLDTIAVCDHNSAENAAAVQRAGKAAGLAVIPGMEITSAEEVHILGLLPDMAAALELQSKVYRALPGRNDENVFGMQVIANEFAEVLGFEEHLLSGATTLNLNSVVAAIHDVDGLAAIVLVNGRKPEPDTMERADEIGIPIISTPMQAFDAIGILFNRNVRGRRSV